MVHRPPNRTGDEGSSVDYHYTNFSRCSAGSKQFSAFLNGTHDSGVGGGGGGGGCCCCYIWRVCCFLSLFRALTCYYLNIYHKIIVTPRFSRGSLRWLLRTITSNPSVSCGCWSVSRSTKLFQRTSLAHFVGRNFSPAFLQQKGPHNCVYVYFTC